MTITERQDEVHQINRYVSLSVVSFSRTNTCHQLAAQVRARKLVGRVRHQQRKRTSSGALSFRSHPAATPRRTEKIAHIQHSGIAPNQRCSGSESLNHLEWCPGHWNSFMMAGQYSA
eukprot:GHVU01120180.1.p1 GENE.GHVU01120180.1~~GHVU01120180.1.p1  ORF type:complete len:117 (-),score=1.97 GHVU01120180.1:239-589(-)